MTTIKPFSSLLFTLLILLICPAAFGAVGMVPSSGTPSCGAIQNGQNLCGTAPATFESNAIGLCPEGTFADIGRWGCYTCPDGFDRGIAAVDSDRACTRINTTNPLEQFVNAKKVGSACPEGSFFDPIRQGECWSCPPSYIRSAAHIDWADACVVLAEEVFSKATEHAKATGLFGTDCPAQMLDISDVNNITLTPKQFWDGIDGKCHSCPLNYVRTGYSVHDSRACSKLISAKHSRATIKGQAKCGDGEITDFLINPEQGGNCYACPAGYDRTIFAVDSTQACETTPEIEFSTATKTTDLTCPANQIFDLISTNHPDVKAKLNADGVPSDSYQSNDWGTCWSCPPGATRSWSSVTASDACVLADVGWNMPVYHQVGLFGLKGATQVILDIISDKDDIVKLAEGYAASTTELTPEGFTQEVWQEISQNPEQSSLLAIAALARLQTYANSSDLKPYEREFLEDFQQQVTNYRAAMAQEALNILKVWQDGAALRYIDPRFNNRPEIVLQKVLWLSIGVLAPPVSPPDFSALIYEYESTPTVDVLVLGMTAAEQSIEPGILTTLMPNDLVGDLAGRAKDKLQDKLLSSAEDAVIDAIKRQIQKNAIKAGTKATAKMIIVGPSTLGPQIAVALFIEYATQWVDFIAGSIDAEPMLKANLAQAQQIYSVSRKLATEEGSLDLRHHYKTMMNSNVAPSAADKLLIEQAVAAHAEFTLSFSTSLGGTVDTKTLPVGYDGTSNTVIAEPNEGYRFISWTDSIGNVISNNPALTLTNVVASETFTANFKIDDIALDGACGNSHQTPSTVAPSSELCMAGSASDVTGTGPWLWSCNGNNGGSLSACATPLLDTVAPSVKAPLSRGVVASGPNGTAASDASLSDFFAEATATDNVDGDLAVTNNAPATLPIGLTVITFTATDNSGNSASTQAIVTISDGPPVVTAPANKIIDATALLTPASLGSATATDAVDGALTATADKTGPFTPGLHAITWGATDSLGNVSTATQTLKVKPLVSFAVDQLADSANGTAIEVLVFLNGNAADYPVTIPFTVGGTANSADHNLTAGNIIINSGTTGSISFNLANNSASIDGETITLTMATQGIMNAAVGKNNTHRITLNPLNESPKVFLKLDQGGLAANSIAINSNGNIVATANVNASNTQDIYHYDWAKTDALLADVDAIDNTFTFDPASLNPGVYQLAVSLAHATNPQLISTAVISVSIQAQAPVLSASVDSDGDGVNDATESYGDTDNDGVPDYLDATSALNILSGARGNSNAFLLETHPGLHLRLGSIAVGSDASQVSASEVESITQIPADNVTNAGGIFDYEVGNLATAGQTTEVIIAQLAPVPANPVYRKLSGGIWANFIEDGLDYLASAEGTEGYCPPPGDNAYMAGLTTGHWCVQLTITDGGPNDADDEANHRVVNLGGVGTLPPSASSDTATSSQSDASSSQTTASSQSSANTQSTTSSQATVTSSKKGGSVPLWLLSLLGIAGLGRSLFSSCAKRTAIA